MIFGVFSLLGTASALDLKEAGVGLAVAVLIDATVVRAVLLPASMKLLGDWKWSCRAGSLGSRAQSTSRTHPQKDQGTARHLGKHPCRARRPDRVSTAQLIELPVTRGFTAC